MSCTITVGGSGEILLQYKDVDGISRSLRSGVGVFSIPDTGSEYKYVVLSGTPDVSVTDGICTLTSVLSNYITLTWEVYKTESASKTSNFGPSANSANYKIKGILVGSTMNNFQNPVPLTTIYSGASYNSALKVAEQMFNLDNPYLVPKSYFIKTTTSNIGTGATAVHDILNKFSLVVDIKDTTDTVYLKIVNVISRVEYLIKATSTIGGPVPSEYIAVTEPCPNIL